MNEGTQFKTIAILSALTMACVVGVGILIIVDSVTQTNSFGIDGIIATLKDALLLLLGALAAMTRQPNSPGSITLPQSTDAGTTTTTATVTKEPAA